jgi:poly(3-hydroxyoctanoate) depolymerase
VDGEAANPGARLMEVSGLRLWTSVRGTGRPLLLINGIGVNLELFDPLRDALDGVRTITFDVPGVGRSPAPWLFLRLPALAGLVAEMLDQLGCGGIDVLGASWGGALAQEFTWRFPGRVRRLILAATSPGCISLPPNPIGLVTLAAPQRYWSRSYLDRAVGALYGGELRDVPGKLWEKGYHRMVRPPTVYGCLGQLAALVGWSSLPWLSRLTQPTLIIAGDDDPVVPLLNARLMARLIPNSRLHVIARGGHLSLLTRAGELAPVILSFLDDARQSSSGRR